jgi:hypothetical protein
MFSLFESLKKRFFSAKPDEPPRLEALPVKEKSTKVVTNDEDISNNNNNNNNNNDNNQNTYKSLKSSPKDKTVNSPYVFRTIDHANNTNKLYIDTSNPLLSETESPPINPNVDSEDVIYRNNTPLSVNDTFTEDHTKNNIEHAYPIEAHVKTTELYIDYLAKEYLSQTYDFCKDEHTELKVHVCMLALNNKCNIDGEPLPFLSFLVNYSEQSEIKTILSVDSPILSENNSIDNEADTNMDSSLFVTSNSNNSEIEEVDVRDNENRVSPVQSFLDENNEDKTTNNDSDKVFGFSQFSFQCTHTDDIESQFQNECMKQFLDLVVVETSITSQTGEQLKELYKGYVEIGENEIVVIFDISHFQHLPLKSTKTPIWMIEYDILQNSFPISPLTKDFLNKNNYIAKVKEIVHSKGEPPKSAYLYNMEKKQYMLRSNKSEWLEARSYDAKYGPFYYLKYMNSRDITQFIKDYRKCAVFMKNMATFLEKGNAYIDEVLIGQPTPVENEQEVSIEESDDLVLSDSDESHDSITKEYNAGTDISTRQLPFMSIISFTRNDELFLCVKTESLFTELM